MERIICIGIDVQNDTNTAHMFAKLDDEVLDYEIGTIVVRADHMIKANQEDPKGF